MNRVSSCCCFSVRTGSLILGWLGFVGGLLGLVVMALVKASQGELEEAVRQAVESGHLPPEQEQVLRQFEPYLGTFITVVLVGYAFTTLINGLLLAGVYKERPGLMLAWIIFTVVGLVLQTLQVLLQPWLTGQPASAAIFSNLFGLALVALGFYFWYCVFCHYRDVKEDRERGQHFTPMKA